MTSILLIIVALTLSLGVSAQEDETSYGVDVSWPMHHREINPNPSMFGDRQADYDTFMKDCDNFYPDRRPSPCLATEEDRVRMNLNQPKSMQNYTEMGFKKIKCPPGVFKLIKQFWDQNRNNRHTEVWFTGNTYTNHWESASYMVSVEDANLRGGGDRLKDALWDAAKSTMEEWTGEELTPCSLYGIRIYENGAILAPHVDRLPLVSSGIINVDQDVDEPWPLEVIGHDGKAHNVTMEPGDMVLYESHTIIHGRPFPLKGRFYANVFIHFEPVGHSLRHDAKEALGSAEEDHVHEKYRKAVQNKHGGHENSQLPPYITPGTPAADTWTANHPSDTMDAKEEAQEELSETPRSSAHLAAIRGDLRKLQHIAEMKPEDLIALDSNGWQPIHEAARSGHLEVVKFLVDNGADINAGIEGNGASPLWIAINTLGEDHPAVRSLEDLGALLIEPDGMEL
jgi:prolyl 4-hydroxylase